MTTSTRNWAADAEALDESLTALSHPLRRHVIAFLAREGPTESEAYEPEDFLGTGDERRRIELYHRHLPMLDDAGIVDWEPEAGRVTRGPRFEDVLTIVESVRENCDELPGDRP